MSNRGFNFIGVFLVPVLEGPIGPGGIVFASIRVQETDGLSLERIQTHLRAVEPPVSLRPVPGGSTGSGWCPGHASDRT